MQVLPPLIIKGVCRVQHLSHVSIDGPNFTSDPEHYPDTRNNKYVNVVFAATTTDTVEQSIPIEPNRLHSPRAKSKEIEKSHETITTNIDRPILQTSSTLTTSTFGAVSTEATSNLSGYDQIVGDDDDDETVVLSSRTSSNILNLQSTTFESLRHSETLFKRQTKRVSTQSKIPDPTLVKTKILPSNMCKLFNDKPFDGFSESLMKIIDEIFENTNHLADPVFAYTQTDFNGSEERIHGADHQHRPRSEPKEEIGKNHSGVQTHLTLLDQLLSSTENICQPKADSIRQSPSERTTSDVQLKNSVTLRATTAMDLQSNSEEEPPTEEVIHNTNLLFKSIQKRKSILYKHQELPFSNVEPCGEDQSTKLDSFVPISPKVSSATLLSSSKTSCHHRKHLRTMVKPVQRDKDSSDKPNHPSTVTPNQSHSKCPPSVRLQNIRRMQLVQTNPDVLRTIDSIQRESHSSQDANRPRTDRNQFHRSKFNDSVIQEAAQTVLKQITESSQHNAGVRSFENALQRNTSDLHHFPPWPSEYLDDSVQREAEIYLKSVTGNCEHDQYRDYEYTETQQSTGSPRSSPTMDSYTHKVFRQLVSNTASPDYPSNRDSIHSESVLTKEVTVSTPSQTYGSHFSLPPTSSLGSAQTKSREPLGRADSKPSSDKSVTLKSTSSSIARQMESIENRIAPKGIELIHTNSGTERTN